MARLGIEPRPHGYIPGAPPLSYLALANHMWTASRCHLTDCGQIADPTEYILADFCLDRSWSPRLREDWDTKGVPKVTLQSWHPDMLSDPLTLVFRPHRDSVGVLRSG